MIRSLRNWLRIVLFCGVGLLLYAGMSMTNLTPKAHADAESEGRLEDSSPSENRGSRNNASVINKSKVTIKASNGTSVMLGKYVTKTNIDLRQQQQSPQQQSPLEYPKWWDKWTSNPKKRVYYGYGLAETKKNAVDRARLDVIEELGITLKSSTECITQGASSSNQGGNRESSNECERRFKAESQETLKGAVVKKRARIKNWEFAVVKYKKPKSKR